MPMSIYNVIGGKHLISQEVCAVSLVLSSLGDHAYIVIEWLNDHDERETYEGHLGSNDGRICVISYMQTNINRLQDIAMKNRANTWSITSAEKNDLIKRILDWQRYCQGHQVNYIKAGPARTVGFFGASLDAVGSSDTKNASIEQVHSFIAEDFNPTSITKSVHDSLIATLKKGLNCAAWAKAEVKTTVGDERYGETAFEKMAECFVVDPRVVVKSPGCTLS